MKYIVRNLFMIPLFAILISIPTLSMGTVYSFGYAIRESFVKDWTSAFRFLGRLIYGTFITIAWMGRQFGKGLDMLWNIWAGEALKDLLKAPEHDNLFCQPKTTVSVSTGHLQHNNKLPEDRIWFSTMLNRMFGQRKHAVGSYMYYRHKKRLEERDFYETIDKDRL